MYIRRTTIKSRKTGEPYYTYRLVESVRIDKKVRQRTLINLGRNFDVPREIWPELSQRIEQIISGQESLLSTELELRFEKAAQRYSALVITAKSRMDGGIEPEEKDYHNIDVNSLDIVRPRSVSVEHVSLENFRQLGLEGKLKSLGFTEPQRAAAIGTIVGRMTEPGSELSTLQWLRERSGLGELIGFDFSNLSIMSLYRVSDRLYSHKERLEKCLYSSEKKLFEFDDVITLYDLTNTYFEGSAKRNKNARLGHSKEKRFDCPLVTLALVLDGSGFPKKSEIFQGNVSEPKTLAEMLGKLSEKKGSQAPTVVLDAGIATEENVSWLQNNHYKYVVVSRKRHQEFNQNKAVSIKNDGEQNIQAQRVVNADTGEVELYCKSSQREKKDQAISELFTQRFEAALSKLEQGLREKGKVKNYEKVLENIGRIKQKYSRVAKYYVVTVKHDENTNKATGIEWKKNTKKESEFPGVYCLRTNQKEWDEKTLWHVYTMLTDLEAVFRSLKSELGLRPVFHHKTDRVSGHLFISVLAYHCVHSVRFQLKNCDVHLSWEGLRRQLKGQERTTVELKRADGKTLHIRRTSRPEPRQQFIYDALGLSDRPGKTEKALIS